MIRTGESRQDLGKSPTQPLATGNNLCKGGHWTSFPHGGLWIIYFFHQIMQALESMRLLHTESRRHIVGNKCIAISETWKNTNWYFDIENSLDQSRGGVTNIVWLMFQTPLLFQLHISVDPAINTDAKAMHHAIYTFVSRRFMKLLYTIANKNIEGLGKPSVGSDLKRRLASALPPIFDKNTELPLDAIC